MKAGTPPLIKPSKHALLSRISTSLILKSVLNCFLFFLGYKPVNHALYKVKTYNVCYNKKQPGKFRISANLQEQLQEVSLSEPYREPVISRSASCPEKSLELSVLLPEKRPNKIVVRSFALL